MLPKISVILPVYNGAKYLQQSIDSVLRQSMTEFEFLIVDDCSKDNSYDILQSIKDARVTVFRNEQNKGLFFNLNFLIAKSGTPLIKLWSQDDVMESDALAEIVKFHEKNNNLGFSYTAVSYIDKNGQVINKEREVDNTPEIINSNLHASICFETGSIAGNIANVTLTREGINKVGLFDENMRMSGDFDMWVRLAQYFDTGFLNKPLIALRDHEEQLSRQVKYNIEFIREDVQVYKKLLSYLPAHDYQEGKKIFRNKRLVYYYTLMLHALKQGRLKVAANFFRCINEVDNVYIMFFYFLKNRSYYGAKS